ncbi:MAG: hypothetical protein MJD61_10295, partial [Proteobacteria bacterium]|nr:hypothetical protein [Pseudomonadota bacterium]
GALGELEIVDVSVDPLDRARAHALAREAQHGLSTHRLWRTSDNGASWQRLGGPFGAELDLVATAFDAAASDPKRVYVSGLGLVPALRGVLLRTDNGGVGWTLLPIAGTGPQAVPFFTAVAPHDRDTIYVRVRGSNRDRLLVSSNGGQSWRSVLEGRAVMAGFALSPEGTEVAIGFGLPDRPGLVDCAALGIWKASTGDLVFGKVFDGPVQCLTWTRRGLYACTHERTQGFQLGLSQDGGHSFGALMKLRSVQGLACPSPSMLATLCAGPWRELCPAIGTPCTGGDAGVAVPPPIGGAPACLSDAGLPVAPGDAGSAGARDAAGGGDGARPVVPGDAGSGAGRRDAGTDADAVSSVASSGAGRGGDARVPGDAKNPAGSPATTSTGGCGCHVAGGTRGADKLPWLMCLLVLGAGRLFRFTPRVLASALAACAVLSGGCSSRHAAPADADASVSDSGSNDAGTDAASDACVPMLERCNKLDDDCDGRVDEGGVCRDCGNLISAGGEHTCALPASGEVKCWGDNGNGQLGDGSMTDRATPVTANAIMDPVEIVLGGRHTCARLSTGRVTCWGYNPYGQLGDGTTMGRATPVSVSGLGGVVEISADGDHTCARLSTNEVSCWGSNMYGQLGNGTTTNSTTHVAVSGLTDAVEVSAGIDSTCARLSTGRVKCWGHNKSGQLGNGTTTDSATPVSVSGLGGVVEISAGGGHTCARLSTNEVSCWGSNMYGQLGNGTTTNSTTPMAVSGLTDAVQVSAGTLHTCVRLSTGEVQCWGYNRLGHLGNGMYNNSSVPVAVSGLVDVVEISAGLAHTCARLSTGEVSCWGYNESGRLGNGTLIGSATPQPVSGLMLPGCRP